MVRSDTDVPWPWSSPLISLGGCSGLFGYNSNDPSLQFVINFPLAATSREVGYCPVGLELLNNMSHCCHRNFKLFRDGLIAFTFKMFVYNFFSDVLGQFSPSLSVVHVQCGTHLFTKQQSDYLSPFK